MSSCPTLVPKYQTWCEALGLLVSAKDKYQETGREEYKQNFREQLALVQQSRQDYENNILKKVKMKGREYKIKFPDALIVKNMNDLLVSGGGEEIGVLSVSVNGLIRQIYISQNQSLKIQEAVSLISYLSRLWLFNCSETQLASLPKLPDSLENLFCAETKITSLPDLSDSLKILSCSNTEITFLPKLPDSLMILDCSNTKIVSLPDLPDSLESINICNTPAAQNPKVITKFEEFKKKHPNAVILY